MLTLKIVSPEKVMFTGEVDSILVPGEQGCFEILPNHAAIISTLLAGKVEYGVKGEKKSFLIHSGFVEVKKNEVSLCVEL